MTSSRVFVDDDLNFWPECSALLCTHESKSNVASIQVVNHGMDKINEVDKSCGMQGGTLAVYCARD